LTDDSGRIGSKRLAPYWKDFDAKTPTDMVRFPEVNGAERPDVWISPTKSIIAQIKASEIVPAKNYSLGFTLRFPRLVKIREDKDWSDCMTTSEVEGIRKLAEGRLTSKKLLANNFRSSKRPNIKSFGPRARVSPHSPTRKALSVFGGVADRAIFCSSESRESPWFPTLKPLTYPR